MIRSLDLLSLTPSPSTPSTHSFVLPDSQQNGGYDYKFVDTVPSKYTCSICTKVLHEAQLTVCCGQHFCASCLTQWLDTQQGKKTCPHCRQENFQHVPNKERIREVNELKIRCTNHSEGCGWVGELEGLRSHLESDKGCGYVIVACTNMRCGEKMTRKDLQTHLQEKCCHRSYKCEHCGLEGTYSTITGKTADPHVINEGHYSGCPEYPLACPNRCGVPSIRRRVMPDHHSSCPLEPLDCPFKYAGCTEKIARKKMEDHMTKSQQEHMLLTYQSLQQLHKQREQDQWELALFKNSISKEITSLQVQLQYITTAEVAQSLSRIKSILQGNLDQIGDMLTLRVTDFHQLRKEKKTWHSPPFSIGDKVRVHLAVDPGGVGRGQGSHVSVSLLLMEVVKKKENMWLEYNVSVTATGQHRPATHKTLELCTFRHGNKSKVFLSQQLCSADFSFPSPGEVLQSEELFLEIEEANSLLQNDAMILELKLLEHQHHWSYDD